MYAEIYLTDPFISCNYGSTANRRILINLTEAGSGDPSSRDFPTDFSERWTFFSLIEH